MNLCGHCKHVRFPVPKRDVCDDQSGEAICFHPEIAPEYTSPVTGSTIRNTVMCLHARSSHGKCGLEGALYVEEDRAVT